MTSWKLMAIAISTASIFFTFGFMVSSASQSKRGAEPTPPAIGGQPAPDVPLRIDFNKRYDLHCSLLGNEPTIFRDVKIVGFTGPKEKVADKEYSLSSSREKYFEQWLVLEMQEKRLVYIPPSSLKYLEETKDP